MRAIALLGLVLAAPAQAVELWTGAGLNARLNEPVSVDLSEGWRLDGPPLETAQYFTQLGTDVRLHDIFSMGLGYRIGQKDDGGVMVFAHRMTLDANTKVKVGEFRVDWRERYQVRLKAPGKDTRHTLRSRLRLLADFDLPVRPGIGAEAFLNLGDGDQTGSGVGIDLVRLEALLRIPVGDLDIDPFYKRDVPVRDDIGSDIFGLELMYNLDFRKD